MKNYRNRLIFDHSSAPTFNSFILRISFFFHIWMVIQSDIENLYRNEVVLVFEEEP
jgi:hypothetical protein